MNTTPVKTSNSDLRVTVYKTSRGQWRWRAQTRNGRIVGASTEAYVRRRRCLENVAAVLDCDIPVWVLVGATSRFVVNRS